MKYFLVYNDNTHSNEILKLIESVKEYGDGFEIVVFNKEDVDIDFAETHKSILSQSRGGGYWLWKPYVIKTLLNKVNDDDIVFYLDSKYYFTEDFTNLYSEYITNNDLLVWKNKPNEPVWYMKNFCKMDVILKYDMYDKVFNGNAEDCWAGAILVRKTENAAKYMNEWFTMCCEYEDITDSQSKSANSEVFIEHRHDQSLLSIVLHKYNIQMQYFERKYLQNTRVPY